CAVALWAVPVAAAVVGDTQVPTVLASLDMSAQRGGAALLDRRHDLELGQAQMPCMGGTVSRACGTEDIGNLERGAQATSAARVLALHQQRQTLKRTGHRTDRLGRHPRVARGRIELAVPEPH